MDTRVCGTVVSGVGFGARAGDVVMPFQALTAVVQ